MQFHLRCYYVVVFLSFPFCSLSVLSREPIADYLCYFPMHTATKILSVNLSVIACGFDKKKKNVVKHIYHNSVLGTICLHMQVTEVLVKNRHLWHPCRCHRRNVVISLSPCALQQTRCLEGLGPAKSQVGLSSRDLLVLVLRLITVSISGHVEPRTSHVQKRIRSELHCQAHAFGCPFTDVS